QPLVSLPHGQPAAEGPGLNCPESMASPKGLMSALGLGSVKTIFEVAWVILFRVFTQPRSQPEELRLSISSPASPHKADVERTFDDRRLVPQPAVSKRSNPRRYSVTSSVREQHR